MSRSRPHPCGYTVEFVSVRKGSPRDNLTRVAVVYSKEGRVPRLEYKTIAVACGENGKMGLSLVAPSHTRPPWPLSLSVGQ